MTSIISELKQINQVEHITFFGIKEDSRDFGKWIDLDLPQPMIQSYHTRSGTKGFASYSLFYAIDGYFQTPKNMDYLNDVQEKILTNFDKGSILLGKDNIPRLTKASHYQPIVHKLSAFNGVYRKRDILVKKDKDITTSFKDHLFDVARHDVYELKRNGLLTYERVYQITDNLNQRLGIEKSLSDVRAKAKAMYEWTEKYYKPGSSWTKERHNEWQKEYYHKHKGEVMSQSEQLKRAQNKANMRKAAEIKTTIKNTVKIMKKMDQKINISQVSEITGISRNTVSKYKSLLA